MDMLLSEPQTGFLRLRFRKVWQSRLILWMCENSIIIYVTAIVCPADDRDYKWPMISATEFWDPSPHLHQSHASHRLFLTNDRAGILNTDPPLGNVGSFNGWILGHFYPSFCPSLLHSGSDQLCGLIILPRFPTSISIFSPECFSYKSLAYLIHLVICWSQRTGTNTIILRLYKPLTLE